MVVATQLKLRQLILLGKDKFHDSGRAASVAPRSDVAVLIWELVAGEPSGVKVKPTPGLTGYSSAQTMPRRFTI